MRHAWRWLVRVPRCGPVLAEATRHHPARTRRNHQAQVLDPAHSAFELLLITSLVMTSSRPGVRVALLGALACHAVGRTWSLVDFVPKARRFERAAPSAIDQAAAIRWTRLGLHPTDYKVLSILDRMGPLGAGEVGRHNGLATASVTNLIDRRPSS